MPWYSSISEELDQVDSIISDSLSISNPELAEMCEHIVTSGGKKIRPAVCILSHKACGGRSGKILDVAAAFEMIHNATLVHDDINDKSEIRRGRKTLHREYTVSKAIVTGDLMFAIGFRLVGSSDGKIIDTVVNASVAMADSEFIQKDLEHTPTVTEEDYMRIIRGKTAMPIHSSAKVGAMMAGASEDTVNAVGEYAMNIGLAFQIVDDLLDVIGDPAHTGKKVGADIMEGKPTMPVIYAMQDISKGARLKEIFAKTEITYADVDEALDLIGRTDALERCYAKAKELTEIAKNAIRGIPDSDYKMSMIELGDYIAQRDR